MMFQAGQVWTDADGTYPAERTIIRIVDDEVYYTGRYGDGCCRTNSFRVWVSGKRRMGGPAALTRTLPPIELEKVKAAVDRTSLSAEGIAKRAYGLYGDTEDLLRSILYSTSLEDPLLKKTRKLMNDIRAEKDVLAGRAGNDG